MTNLKVKEDNKLVKAKYIVLIAAFLTFAASLFYDCCCVENRCISSVESLVFGVLVILVGGSAICWLANPLLLIAWVLIGKTKKLSIFFAMAASVLSLLFLKFDSIITNEGGVEQGITTIQVGYWLWLISCLITFIGSLVIYFLKRSLSK